MIIQARGEALITEQWSRVRRGPLCGPQPESHRIPEAKPGRDTGRAGVPLGSRGALLFAAHELS